MLDIQILIEKVAAAGVVGAGGSGFPTAYKFITNNPIHTVIVNGAECEPLLKADQGIVVNYAEKLMETLSDIVQIIGAESGVIAIKKSNDDMRDALDIGKSHGYPNLKIHYLPSSYPVGDEHILVYRVTEKVIPPGGIPLDIGVVVINVETLYNIHLALNDLPVTHKFCTITGQVPKPQTVRVPLGVSLKELLKCAGLDWSGKDFLIEGGPCMGNEVNPDTPVTKTTKGVIVLPYDNPLVDSYRRNLTRELQKALSVCCQCRQCTDYCPRYLLGHPLEPHRIMRAVSCSIVDHIALPQALLCSECGICDHYACPFQLSPRKVNRKLKEEFLKNGYRWYDNLENIRNMVNNRDSGCQVEYLNMRQVPVEKLINRLGIKEYDQKIPWQANANSVNYNSVTLPLKQHIGESAVAVVKQGEHVDRGTLIASVSRNTLGANLHASISGTVTGINRGEITIRGDKAS